MKKILCVVLAAMLLVACLVGCKSNPDDLSQVSSVVDVDNTPAQEDFKKPQNYASVVTVTINPQFRLYLDASGTVLAVEPVNDDAKSIEAKIVFENKNVQEVVNNLVVAANDGGFVKNDAKIDIKITEIVDETVVAAEILDSVKTSVTQKLTELDIKIEVTTAVEVEEQEPTQSEATDTTSSEEETKPENPETSKPENIAPEVPECKHTNTTVKSVSTGNNIIDNSKFDVVNHAKVCKDCGEQIALEKHTVSDGKCTVCGQSNLAVSTIYPTAAGVSGNIGLNAPEINDNGSLSYNLVIEKCWWDAEGEWLDMWNVKITEAEMLKAIRKKFVMSDSEFEKLKAKGSYECSLGTQTYSDGYFYCCDPAAGGPGDYSHEIIGYKDNKNGTFLTYYDCLLGGPDVEENEREHQYYYAVEYTYSGASNLSIEKVDEDGYVYYNISGWTPVVNSMRIKSIKKVADISGIIVVK